jgi:hypothetical protein
MDILNSQFVLGLLCGIGLVGLVLAAFPNLVRPRS